MAIGRSEPTHARAFHGDDGKGSGGGNTGN